MTTEIRILPSPLGPDVLRTCPRCERRNALVFVRCDNGGTIVPTSTEDVPITVYRCRWCGEETEFAACHPDGAV